MQTYQQDLKNAFDQRVQANTSYSLRAFARDCGISPSFLSNVLNGRKTLAEKSAYKIAKNIFDSEARRKVFLSKVRLSACQEPELKQKLQQRVSEIEPGTETKKVSSDQYELISDWQIGYIYEYMKVKPIDSLKIDSVARILNIQSQYLQMALDRLQRLGLTALNERGFYEHREVHIQMESQPSDALLHFHKKVLKKGYEILEKSDRDERHFEASIIAMNKTKYKEVQQKLEELHDLLLKCSEDCDQPDRIMLVNTHFYSLIDLNESTEEPS